MEETESDIEGEDVASTESVGDDAPAIAESDDGSAQPPAEDEPAEDEPATDDAKDAEATLFQRVRRWVPASAFFVGFAFDSITLGKRVDPIDLVLVSGYVTIALMTLFLSSRYFSEKTNQWIHTICQFCIGGTFSALVVLYFKSAGGWLSLFFVVVLMGVMVWNEFFHHRESQREITWAVFCVCLVMTLNFVIPHVLKSVHPLWFYLSTGAAVAVLVGLWKLTKYPPKVMRTALVSTGLLLGMYTFDFIPPVPLVLKDALICTDLKKEDGEYRCDVEKQNFLASIKLTDQTIHPPGGGPVHCLTAVFAPKGISVKMEHRWFRKTDDGWKQTDKLRFTMKGGRKGGWRYHTRKRNIPDGEWRVETAVQEGAVLGYIEFDVDRKEDPANFERERQGL